MSVASMVFSFQGSPTHVLGEPWGRFGSVLNHQPKQLRPLEACCSCCHSAERWGRLNRNSLGNSRQIRTVLICMFFRKETPPSGWWFFLWTRSLEVTTQLEWMKNVGEIRGHLIGATYIWVHHLLVGRWLPPDYHSCINLSE